MVVLTMDPVKRAQVLDLMKEKERIEEEINQCGTVLRNNRINMTDPLVDNNDCPRNDIDVYQVRHARHRIICLQNDLKNIMKAIENGLHEIHEPLLSAGASSSDSATSLNIQKGADLIKELHIQKSMKKKPFAKITVVSVDSPAQQAGLIVGDVITEFGSLHFDNFTSLHQIGQIVSNSVGKNVVVVVLRHGAPMKLNLVPQKWHGQGFLGCNVISLDDTKP